MPFFSKNIRRLALLMLILVVPINVEAIPVTIFNDLDKEPEGKMIEVEEVETIETRRIRYRLKIYPGQDKQIARGSVIRFSLSRVFPAHKLKYEVKCPKGDDPVTINIQEIHDNKMPGGCTLERIGHWSRRTGVNWTKVKNEVDKPSEEISDDQDTKTNQNDVAPD